jgi:phage tail-like protein
VEIGRFSEITGLNVSVDVEEIIEGGENGYAHKLPGRMSWPNLIFKRGISQGDALFKWFNKTAGEQFSANGNKLARSTAAITLMGPGGKRLRAWNVDGAFPIKWSGPNFSMNANAAAAVEELEIAHHGFRAQDL